MELFANLTKAMDPRPQENAQRSNNVCTWPQTLLASLGLSVGRRQVPRLPDGKCLPREQEYDSSGLILAIYLEKEHLSVSGTIPGRPKVRKYITSYVHQDPCKRTAARALFFQQCLGVTCDTLWNVF